VSEAQHWGVYVNSEEPIIGVLLAKDPEFLLEIACDYGIDLAWEEHLKECQEEEHDFCEIEETFLLIGFRQRPDGKYEPDTKAVCSVVIEGIYAQVVRSRYTSRAELCSPCFPGKADLGTPGEYLAYTLPPDLWGDTAHLSIEESASD